MEQTRALNALAPFLALAKSATSPRAAVDLITQATSAPNTYVFAELLHQSNIQALANDEQHAFHLELLKVFAYGTCESYNGSSPTLQPHIVIANTHPPPASTSTLPPLFPAQKTKLRLLSLLSIAAQKHPNLTYPSLCARLSLDSAIDLEHLVTQAIYNDLLSATLNPASQTVVITSVAPLRDLAPGSVGDMIAELGAWSGRCEAVLGELEAEVAKVKAEARRRNMGEARTERQVSGVNEEGGAGKGASGGGGGNVLGDGRGGRMLRGSGGGGGRKLGEGDEEEEDEGDAMDLDGGNGVVGGRKRSGGLMGKLGGGRTGR
ncbi:hypothetical protein LTR78_009998 [Recurvomyces mirabilis]|uniref:PCI domain-containing protein n=1 Tax=Recurvomyces mirabilis TaxID=574656 RepID=A0AAE0TQL0_9PEZI|nr:hypothetical protein LTR78_009998 [Recurvomyces mirabilis]KAK5160339.1 hypothetical protein LTS14_001351 [Recurvomyces mirabilis]